MAELESVIEQRLIDQLCSGESQWTYRPDIKTEEQIWANFKYILEQNNKAKLGNQPLSESEFAKIKNDVSHASFYDAGKWLVGENGKVYVHIQRGNEQLHLLVMNNEHIAGGSSVYEVINQYETQEYKDYIQLRSRWHAEGLTKESLLTDSEKSGAVMRGGKLYQPFRILSTYKPGVETEDAIANGVEFVYKKIGAPILTSSGVTSTLNAVSATSRYPERALQMLNLMNTDKELFNTVYLGLEGIHYTKIGENKVKQSETNRFSPAAWVLGNQFNAYILDGQADDVWEETKKLNDEAQLSPLYGFLPDTKKISVQLASCKSVVGEYKTALGEGVGDTDQLYSEFIAKLDAAGVNTLIDELQTQIDAWVAKK